MLHSFKILQKPTLIVYLLALLAFILHFITIYHGVGAHPDERLIMMSVMSMKWNWLEMKPITFSYGSVPFYFLFFLKEGITKIGFPIGYDELFLVGRTFSGIIGSGCIVVLYYLSQFFFKSLKWAMVPSFLLFFNWFFFQNSHFYTVDIYLTFFLLLSILNFFHFMERQNINNVLLASCFFALGFSCKVSALSMGIFILGIPIYLLHQKKIHLKSFIIFLLTFSFFSIILICALQPHAIAHYSLYITDVLREGAMVRGEYVPPYTLQYIGTTPYLYCLKQMFLYTLGPIIFLLSLIGGLSLFFHKNLWRNSPSVLIFFIWMIASFIVIGSFQVKFPRYLLTLYPGIMILSALGLQALIKIISEKNLTLPIRKKVILSLFIISFIQPFFYLCSYFNIFTEEHSSITAALWMGKNIESDSKVLRPHWDDWLPANYSFNKNFLVDVLPIYDARETKNWESISQKLSENSYIVFPSHKIFDSYVSTGDQEKLPQNFVLKLFSGELGYKLVKTIKPEFKFLFFKLDFQQADETLSVYDAPKVSIFQNSGKLPPEKIKSLVTQHFSSNSHYSEVLLENANLNQYEDSLYWIICWIFIFYITQLITFPIICSCLKQLPDQGYAFNKVLGPTFFVIIIWFFVRLNLIYFNRFSICLIWLSLAAITTAANFYFKLNFLSNLKSINQHIIKTELLFILVFAFFTILRSRSPEIFWSEKPMDFSFLNYFIRNNTFPLPPEDPWASGTLMKYYYFSSFFLASFHKLINLPSFIGFNLSLITIASFLATTSYGFFILFTKNKKLAFIGALIPLFYCNIAPIKLFLINKLPLDFALFWQTSRLLAEPGFVEFPLWSFLFSDVHAHVFSLPYTIIFFATIYLFWKESLLFPKKMNVKLFFVTSFSSACLAFINGWDFIFYSLFSAFILLFSYYFQEQKNWGKYIHLIGKFIHLQFLTFLWIFIYLKDLSGGIKPYIFIQENIKEMNTLLQLMNHYGLIWFSLIASLVLIISKNMFFFDLKKISLMLLTWSFPIFLFLYIYFSRGHTLLNYPIYLTIFFFITLFSIFLCFYPKNKETNFLFLALIYASWSILFWEQVCFLDRLNTIFKFHYPIFSIFIFGTIGLILYFFSNSKTSSLQLNSFNEIKHVKKILFYFPLFISAISCLLAMASMFNHPRHPALRTTLDGIDYLRLANPEEYDFIHWINKNITGTHVVAEAYGDCYSDSNRIAMHTGLTTVLGWKHHAQQRGLSNQDGDQRIIDLSRVYTSKDKIEIQNIIRKYHIEYVVLGKVEKRNYKINNSIELKNQKELFATVYENPEYTLFKVLK